MTVSRRAAIGASLALATAAAMTAVAFAPIALAAGPDDISIVQQTFQPANITVNVGDTVTWTVTQEISQPHSVTSGTPGGTDSGQVFDSGIKLAKNGDNFAFKFTQAGTFPYYCQVHPTTMTGTITVLAAGQSGPPASAAASTPPSAAASEAPSSAAPGGSGGPSASAPAPSVIPGEDHAPVPTSDKVTAAGILAVALVLLFGSAALYRRVNR